MTSKTTNDRLHLVPSIPTSDKVLASRITLPSEPCVVYALMKPSFTAPNSLAPHDAIELARRTIISQNSSASLLDSVLLSVHNGTTPVLYLFIVAHQDAVCVATERLSQFSSDGLTLAESSSFGFQEINCFLPDTAIRNPYSHFLESVRLRAIADIVRVSHETSPGMKRQPVKRFKDGFILSQSSRFSDWASSWDYKSKLRPLTYFHLQVQASFSNGAPSHLIIHATPLPTPFLHFSHCFPLPSGSPIVLLPYGTPAYFLAKYGGPTTGLIKQFRDSLHGLGVGDWESRTEDNGFAAEHNVSPEIDNSNQTPLFILGWIKVENKQGEDKGIIFIWPARLCLSSQSRPPLDYIPELPSPLQPSPQVPSSIPALSTPRSHEISQATVIHSDPFHDHAPPVATQATSDSLHAFRSLTLSKSKGIRQVAGEVGGYVDAVARERERERERLKRERENGTSSSPKLTRTTANTPASAPTPMSTEPPTSIPPITQTSHIIGTSAHQTNPTTNQHQTVQNFYPSPPQTNHQVVAPTTNGKTSPVMESSPPLPLADAPIVETSTPVGPISQLNSRQSSSTAVGNYDPFNNMDSTWSQPTDSYLTMDMEMDFGMDMEMGFSMNINSGVGGGVNYNEHQGGVDYEDAFTDDDFSFFDRPSKTSNAPPTTIIQSHRNQSGTTPDPGSTSQIPMIPDISHMFYDVNISGLGPPLQSLSNIIEWTPSVFVDRMTPRSADLRDSSQLPDLLPPSPCRTLQIHSAPPTPSVHLNFDPNIRSSSVGSCSSSLFMPIPFAPYHRATDIKYSSGKFALPNSMSEVDSFDTLSPLSLSPTGQCSWRSRYNSITDPRVGVVRKLIGIKRKTSFPHGGREKSEISSWLWAQDGWEKPEQIDINNDARSNEADSEDDDNDEFDNNESSSLSRPCTPPPAYLPLGPSLLHSHFQHSQILPLSTPLRPPGSAVTPTNLASTVPVVSVPTPVSPAATLGAASEKSKSLESAACAIAREVVENPLWAETWRIHNTAMKQLPEVWPADIKAAAQLLGAVPSLEGTLDISSLFDLGASGKTLKTLETLEAPLISVGKSDAILHVLPPALRFWEKLGLAPKGGVKDLTAYVLFEDDDDQRHSIMDNWLGSVRAAYKARHMGDISRGSDGTSKCGLLPIRFDTSFRKTLASFTSNINGSETPVVILMIVPISIMTLASSVLRQVLSASKKAAKSFPEGRTVFQLIPEPFIFNIGQTPHRESSLDILCSSIYNRVNTSIKRLTTRRIHHISENVHMQFQQPNFTLARPPLPKVTYARSAHASLDVLDRFTLLHIAYHISACGKWILASSVDQRGEAYDLRVWLTQSPEENESTSEPSGNAYAISKVWDFALEFAKKADVEWRVVISKLGVMAENEMAVWEERVLDPSDSAPSMHVSLVSVDTDAPWTIIHTRVSTASPSRPPRSTSSTSKHHNIFTDVSATTYALFPNNHLTVSLLPPTTTGFSLSFVPEPCNPASQDIQPSSSHISSTNDIPHDQATSHSLSPMPRSTATLIRVPCNPSTTSITMLHIYLFQTFHLSGSSAYTASDAALISDITRNYHELAVLATCRFHLNTHRILPFHLAAVDAMRMSLDRDWDRLESPIES